MVDGPMTQPAYKGVTTNPAPHTLDQVQRYLRENANVINRINQGKFNAVLEITLNDFGTTTTITDARLTRLGSARFDPLTADAATELAAGTMYVTAANRRNGEWTITHSAADGEAMLFDDDTNMLFDDDTNMLFDGTSGDRTFKMVMIG